MRFAIILNPRQLHVEPLLRSYAHLADTRVAKKKTKVAAEAFTSPTIAEKVAVPRLAPKL